MLLLIGFIVLIGLGALLLATPLVPQLWGSSFRSITTTHKVVALTYDDGPNPLGTPAILDLLKKYTIKATFFMVGKNIKKYPQLAQRVWQEGHEVGNHSWSHPLMLFKSGPFIRRQITKTESLLRNLGYTKEIHFRAPYGMKFFMLPTILKQLHKIHILFDDIGFDFKKLPAASITKNVLEDIHPGAIILLHDGTGNQEEILKASEAIIQRLLEVGYTFVTISTLLSYQNK